MPDGDLEYLGRIDDQVKLRGFRIELAEIEAVLCGAPGVDDAIVGLSNNSSTGLQLIAHVVQDSDKLIAPAALREHVAQHLPEYMVPAAYVGIQQVPRTVNDKVDRTALPPPTAADYPSAGGGELPRDDWERAVARVFSEVLETTVTARDSDLFHLGGDSLLATRVAILCQERLHVDLPVSAIFDSPTVAALAERVRREHHLGRVAKTIAHVSRRSATPLSPQQFALWLDLKIRLGADAYNEVLAFRVKRRLDPARLLHTLVQLAQAHEVLRARLIEVGREPQLVFDREAAAVEFEFSDAGASDKLTEATQRPFNLHEGPLWRAMLCHEPEGESVLVLVLHHIILDYASEEILLGELIANYSNADEPRMARAYDFADLATHERDYLASEVEALERFWAKNLAGAKLTLDLPPPCVPCSPEAEDLACISRREIEPALARRVRDLAASWGSTPFNIYLTAYLTLLRKYATSDELVVGSPLSLRDTPATNGVVGYLLSPAALRVQLAKDLSFREAAGIVALRWREVGAHARLPMHFVLNSAVGAQRTRVGSPIQTYFSLVQDPTDSRLIDGCALEQIHLPPAHAKFNLFLLVLERQSDASLVLEYRRGTFDPEMADRFLRHLEVLLLAATENPDSSLAKLPLADQTELARLREWGTHSTSYPRDRTVAEIFEEVAGEYQGKTAVVVGGDKISYGALNSHANKVAAMLRRAGVCEGDRVPLLLPRGVQFIACALGVMKCGAAYVPLDPSYPAERLRRMLEGLGAFVGLRKAAPLTSDGAINWLDVKLADEPLSILPPSRKISAVTPAYVMFTSGSIGRPKGVEVPHRAIVRLVFGQDFARIGPAETWLHMAPTSFDASTLEIWAPLLHGGCCVILEEGIPTPSLLAEVIRRESVTSVWITSSLFNVIVDEAPACLSGLQQILIGGEALSPSHVRRAFDHLPGVRLVNGYGPTENTTFTCCHVIRREDVDPRRTIPIGRPIANTTVHVFDSDGSFAPIGVPGELVAGGDGVANGYIGQPEKNLRNFLPDAVSKEPNARLYRSGDRVRWRPDGTIEFLGRFDNQVKIRGYRVEPDEVAACLAEQACVRQVVVIPHRSAAGAAQLVACVVPKSEDYSAPELRKLLIGHASERLPPYMVPTKFLLFHELPLKPNGKLDLAALHDAKHDSAPVGGDALLSSTESRVLGIMREVLRDVDLSLDTDFFEKGGDSLLAIELMLRLDSEIGRNLPVRALDAAFTARRLAALLDDPAGSRAKYPAGVVEISLGTTDRPLFCLPGMGGTALGIRALTAKLHTYRPIYAIELHNLQVGLSVLESMECTAAAVIERMCEVQSGGPFAILGYSFGGNLAVEVARQLVAKDQPVELVVIIDAYAPGSLRSPGRLKRLANHLRFVAHHTLGESHAYILSRVQRRLFTNILAPEPTPPLPKSELERQVAEVSERCKRAYGVHRPEAFSGRIVLIAATDRDDELELTDPSGACGWNSICKGGVDVIPVACRHLDFFKEPHVTDLARRIDDLLSAIDKAP
jgi:amino acid adenylation domain-containing protein